MSDDIVKRLLIRGCGGTLHEEAAADIKRLNAERDDLRAEVERLREALTDIANTFDESWALGSVERSAGDRARAILAETEATNGD